MAKCDIEIKECTNSRVSVDIRFVNKKNNLNVKIGKVHTGYVEFSKSPIEQTSANFYLAQK